MTEKEKRESRSMGWNPMEMNHKCCPADTTLLTTLPSFAHTLGFHLFHFMVVNKGLWKLTELQGGRYYPVLQTKPVSARGLLAVLIWSKAAELQTHVSKADLPILWSILGRVTWQYLLRPGGQFLVWHLPCWAQLSREAGYLPALWNSYSLEIGSNRNCLNIGNENIRDFLTPSILIWMTVLKAVIFLGKKCFCGTNRFLPIKLWLNTHVRWLFWNHEFLKSHLRAL